MAAQTAAMRPAGTSLPETSSMIQLACSPISRKTVFSRMKAMVRQFIRSAMRDWAVWMIGALWPSSSPAMTTATTPEAWNFSARMKAANGTTNEIAVSSSGSVTLLRSQATTTNPRKPTNTPPSAARAKSPAM